MHIDERPRDQITVTLDRELRETVARIARSQERTVSAQVRHFLAKAIAAEQGAQAA
jgi:predicted transcriptional regulator